ncbi:uncharacterized protein LOC126703466 [Quercus robur]|uniref:uncharacterized protein LOC126703466 n=1 Tax=Quercus robur TaxID=38942 RepID=UPI002161782C|nr:uncharacterized protein LOC126703466 [Quercus robur]
MVVVKLIFLCTLYNWMATMGGLANDDNYHAFCHLLGRFKVNYQVQNSFSKDTEFAFIFLPSLLCFKMADRRGSRKTPLSLNHYCLLQDLSAPPSTLSTMMVFPNSQGSLILILLHMLLLSFSLLTSFFHQYF